jgi:hypothetical protein
VRRLKRKMKGTTSPIACLGMQSKGNEPVFLHKCASKAGQIDEKRIMRPERHSVVESMHHFSKCTNVRFYLELPESARLMR